MIDLHTHILPGIDDGPASIIGAVELARAAVAAGVTEVVATPHVSPSYPNDPQTIAAAVAELRFALDRAGVPLRVHAGAELDAEHALELAPEELRELRIGDGPFLLLECPLGRASHDIEPIVDLLHARGHRVLLAHPERSPLLQAEPAQLDRLVAAGALTAVTSSAFQGAFGRTAQRFALRLLRERLVHTLASDMHDVAHRPPGIVAPPALAGEDAHRRGARFAWFAQTVPAAILTGSAIPSGPAPPRSGRMRWTPARWRSRPRSA